MRLVIVESPFSKAGERGLAYARAAMRDCLMRGESPMASHVLLAASGVLDDDKAFDRWLGIEAGLAWGWVAEATVVYENLGVSDGMKIGIARAEAEGRPVEYRTLRDFV